MFSTVWLNILLNFILMLPLVVVYVIQVKRNRMRHIIVTFSAPDGTKRQMPLKIGFSWTIFFFGGWALLFRGQFWEFLILFFLGWIFGSLALLSLNGFETTSVIDVSTLFKNATALGIAGFILFNLINMFLRYYYVLYGNKIRLRNLYHKGFSFDDPRNGNIDDLYEYIGMKKRINVNDLMPNVKRGSTHDYVVPEKNEVKINESDFDYSNLTMQDLKLLLKSESIAFNSDETKEDLLELVNEYIVKPKKEKIKKQIEAKQKEQKKLESSKYFELPISEIMEKLEKKGIKYGSSSTKLELIKLLEESENN